ncbi:MAG: hypothetical protein WCQ65_12005 [Fermentimonas sp.]|jgi:hypothetical protein
MTKIYELNEYENVPGAENTYSEREVKIFTSPDTCLRFIREDDFYGACFIYEQKEYEEYYSSRDPLLDIPEPICQFTVDSNTTLKDLKGEER